MMTCFLQGGLGNQLFQIFATIAYSFKTQQSFVFLKTDILALGTNTPRKTYWNDFLSHLTVFTTPFLDMKQFSAIQEREFSYQDLKPMDKNPNQLLYGYFQSYKYFSEERENIDRLIHLDEKKQQVKNKYTNLGDFDYIALHFRIGDYKKLQQYHYLLPLDYYHKSLEYIVSTSTLIPKKVLVFCESTDLDDVIKIVSVLIDTFPQFVFELINFAIPDWEKMILMSFAKHNILANSSYSWWGAYLSDYNNNNKIVCYPSIWFGPAFADKNTKDLCPPECTKISITN
jgi:hypothetical protein